MGGVSLNDGGRTKWFLIFIVVTILVILSVKLWARPHHLRNEELCFFGYKAGSFFSVSVYGALFPSDQSDVTDNAEGMRNFYFRCIARTDQYFQPSGG